MRAWPGNYHRLPARHVRPKSARRSFPNPEPESSYETPPTLETSRARACACRCLRAQQFGLEQDRHEYQYPDQDRGLRWLRRRAGQRRQHNLFRWFGWLIDRFDQHRHRDQHNHGHEHDDRHRDDHRYLRSIGHGDRDDHHDHHGDEHIDRNGHHHLEWNLDGEPWPSADLRSADLHYQSHSHRQHAGLARRHGQVAHLRRSPDRPLLLRRSQGLRTGFAWCLDDGHGIGHPRRRLGRRLLDVRSKGQRNRAADHRQCRDRSRPDLEPGRHSRADLRVGVGDAVHGPRLERQ